MKPIFSLIFLSAYTLAIGSTVNAQSPQDAQINDQDPKSIITILPIGQNLPTILDTTGVDKDGRPITKERAFDKKYSPPSTVEAKVPNVEKSVPIYLSLNSASKQLKFASKKTLLLPSLSLTIKPKVRKNESGRTTGVLSQNLLLVLHAKYESKSWANPKHFFLANDWKSFPENSVRIVNVTSKNMIAVFKGGEKIIIKSGGNKVIDLKSEKDDSGIYTLRVFAEADEGPMLMQQMALTKKSGRRQGLYFYHNTSNPKQKPIIFTKTTDNK